MSGYSTFSTRSRSLTATFLLRFRCSSPMQPHCSARLRSLLDDYQTAFSRPRWRLSLARGTQRGGTRHSAQRICHSFSTTATRTAPSGCCSKAGRPACFLRIPVSTFCLYTAHMCSIVGDSSWHFHRFPPGRGGSYGTSGCHLRTPGSEPDGALHRDCGAPGDLPRLVP